MHRKPGDPLIVPMSRDDVYAIQALAAGEANPGQQRRALDYIINTLCGTYDLSYRPGGGDGDRATCFAEGRRFAGLKLVMMTKLTGAAIEALGKPHGK